MNKTHARHRYHAQRSKARARGIEFELTFDQWYQWWLDQGHDRNSPESTGRSAQAPCMCRHNDSGPYSLSNIYCATREQNSRDARTFSPSPGRGTGWARPVETPDAVFPSLIAAAQHYSVTPEAVQWRIQNWNGWSYQGPSRNTKRIQTPAGLFDSQVLAAQALGVPVSTVARRRKSHPEQYYYV